MPLIIPGVVIESGVAGPGNQSPGPPDVGASTYVRGPEFSVAASIAVWVDTAGRILRDSLALLDVNGNLATPGTINGRHVDADGAALDALVASSVRLPTTNQKAALAGTNGSPSVSNKYVTDSDPRLIASSGVQIGGQIGGTNSVPYILGIRETAGPTLLTFGNVGDGKFLRRSGSTIIGDDLTETTVATAISYTISQNDDYIGVTNVGANRVMTLPSVGAVPDGKRFDVKDESGTAGITFEIRIQPAGADLLDGLNTYKAIYSPWGSLGIIQRAGKWWTV